MNSTKVVLSYVLQILFKRKKIRFLETRFLSVFVTGSNFAIALFFKTKNLAFTLTRRNVSFLFRQLDIISSSVTTLLA